ncbi:hypothetical protein BX265_2316 [Streptomyces sp. TLI_235]|nr:hypothetical protein [Streptomyces sp. TLI_235]PBC77565.1 hypothetical protein BX265_2316 [Streptomyces sp. TLI_235]
MRQLLILARRTASTTKAAVRSVITPGRLFTTNEPALHIPPVGLFEADEIPPAEDIDAAAREFNRAADQARAADRGKRAARKILDRLPVGTYGAWSVERVPSGRQTADLDKIRKIFKEHGLGPVPMKTAAPSLKVTRVETLAPAADGVVKAVAA